MYVKCSIFKCNIAFMTIRSQTFQWEKKYLQVSFGWVELVQIKSGLFTQNGSDSLKCIAAQHCLSN